jgi:hypothetical protein
VAVTHEQFIVQFPEFVRVPRAPVEAMLARAEDEVNRDIFAGLADNAIMYLAAHRLALSPAGQGVRTDPSKGNGASTYEKAFSDLVRKACAGAWVV